MDLKRCGWVTNDPLYLDYHDHEWGKPVYDERKLFEMLCLEGQQAGLSWITILKRRESYREAFDNFDPEKISNYDEKKIQQLLTNEGIIRYRLKIEAIIKNANALLKMKQEGQNFTRFIWSFVDGEPIQNQWKSLKEVPVETDVSKKMSKELKKRGFTFCGSTICYAYMQAVGLVNDHIESCHCYHK